MKVPQSRAIIDFCKKHWFVGAVVLYGVSRFFALLSLPVFADESIYIRWAQLMLHDKAYLFFSMNDGKPPLFIWILGLALQLPAHPLFLARAVSVIVGFLQLFASDRLTRAAGGKLIARVATAVYVILSPFWFFHHRMALMDALLTLFITITAWGLLRITQESSFKKSFVWIMVSGFSWGLALWTKIPALFLAPWFFIVALWSLWQKWTQEKERTRKDILPFFSIAMSGALGLLVFLILKTQPNFGTLFSRGGDFSFSISEILAGQWRTSLDNVGRLINWTSNYARPEALSLAVIVPFIVARKKRGTILVLWLGGLVFCAPLLLIGRTLHPRYFLPLMAFLTPLVALGVEEAWRFMQKSDEDSWFGKIAGYLLLGFFLIGSLRFLFFSYFDPNQTPFVLADRSQYLTEWSSGHGIQEVRDLIIRQVQSGERLTVVTEGSFGTLPDALLLEFDRRPEIQYLRIEGLAQYPVKFLPDWVLVDAEKHPTWLVVNEHRLEMSQENLELIGRFPRPYGAPDLLLFSIKPLQKQVE